MQSDLAVCSEKLSSSYARRPRREVPMPSPRIAAVATAVPPYRFTQSDILALAGYTDLQRRGFFAASDIEGRYLYLNPEGFRPDESVDDLNDRFKRGAI